MFSLCFLITLLHLSVSLSPPACRTPIAFWAFNRRRRGRVLRALKQNKRLSEPLSRRRKSKQLENAKRYMYQRVDRFSEQTQRTSLLLSATKSTISTERHTKPREEDLFLPELFKPQYFTVQCSGSRETQRESQIFPLLRFHGVAVFFSLESVHFVASVSLTSQRRESRKRIGNFANLGPSPLVAAALRVSLSCLALSSLAPP